MARIRNFGVAAHIDAGKTTVSERILYYTGKTHKMGEVHDGDTVMDWMIQERERGITITSAVTSCAWRGHDLHLVDTPGHVDFSVEVERCMRVLDGVVIVFCAVGGVEPQSETVWNQAERYHVPRVTFINKMDRVGADFAGCIEEMRQKLGAKPIVMQLPWGAAETFRGIIDLVKMEATTWHSDDLGATFEHVPIPRELEDDARLSREALIEAVADLDDGVAEKYLAGTPLAAEDLIAAVRRVTVQNRAVPVFCGSGLRNKGIQPLLDAIVDFLPSPVDVPPIEGKHPQTGVHEVRHAKKDEPFSALAFKIATDEGRKLVFVRVYSGVMETGSDLWNPRLKEGERLARILRMHANKRERVEKAEAGDIVAVVGLKRTTTGDSLCDAKHPIALEPIEFLKPVISLAIEPKTQKDKERLDQSLAKLADEDPTVRVHEDPETGQTILSGMGELHLEILVDRLLREFGSEARVGKPQVVYRETVRGECEAEGRFERKLDDAAIFGHVRLRIASRARGTGNTIVDSIANESLPPECRAALSEGVAEGLASGIHAGYPVEDVDVTLSAAEFREGGSAPGAYKAAAGMALRKAAEGAGAFLLEPVMAVEVVVPDEFVGEILGDLGARRGKIEGMRKRGDKSIVDAFVPLRRMFGYSTAVRSMSQGRASFTMHFARYDDAGTD